MTTLVTTATKLRNSPGSLYLHITTLLRRRIQSGEWQLGQKVPTLEALAREFGVARVTVRQAMSILESEGLIWRKQGKGTFVREDILSGPWFALQTDWPSLVRMITFGDSAIELRKVRDDKQAPPLNAADGRPAKTYQYMQRVHSKNQVPYAVIHIYLDRRIYLKAPREFSQRPVISVLERIPHLKIGVARQQLTIGTADIEVADLLQVPVNSPIAQVRRIIQDRGGTVIYFGDLIYRGDFVKLDINLK
ncbi:MAG: GntR family transcriptional regulator [Betaproteobacteria bacterium]|nr:MAG: GntR family transcriptional regulator [Betaproteobacteria bacterium]